MIDGLYAIGNIAIVFVGVFFLVALIYYISRKSGPVKSAGDKRKIFACGEDATPNTMNIAENGFFINIGKVLGIHRLKNIHDGDLSNYMTWIFIGMIILILVMVMAW